MTRGWYVLIDKKGEIHPVYSGDSSYLSYRGKILFQKYRDRTLAWYILSQEDDPDLRAEEADDFRMSWIYEPVKTRSKYRYDYAEYGYVYDEKKDTMQVYYFGQKLFTVNRNNIKKCLYIAEHDFALQNAVCYVPEKLKFDYSRLHYKELLKLPTEVLEALKGSGENTVFAILRADHCRDVWYSQGNPSWAWTLSFENSDMHGAIRFIASKGCNSEWDCYIQLPYVRAKISVSEKAAKSETALKKSLRGFIQEHEKELLRFLEICNLVEDFKTSDMYVRFFKNEEDSPELEKEITNAYAAFKVRLEEEWEKEPWLTLDPYGNIPGSSQANGKSYFSIEDIQNSIYSSPRWWRTNRKMQAESNSQKCSASII